MQLPTRVLQRKCQSLKLRDHTFQLRLIGPGRQLAKELFKILNGTNRFGHPGGLQ